MSVASALLLASTVAAAAAAKVRVRVDRVNVRDKPALKSHVVGQVAKGQVLEVRRIHQGWVEIVPPANARAYVYGEFVEDGEVQTAKLMVRSGPSINYGIIGSLVRDDRVTVVETDGDWLRIKPPPDSSLWISRELVTVMPPPEPPRTVATPTPPPPVKALPPPQVVRVSPPPRRLVKPRVAPPKPKVRPDPPPPPPSDLNLVPLRGQGNVVSVRGTVRPAHFVLNRPSRYRLVVYDNKRVTTVCYLKGNNEQLASFLGNQIEIEGREYWVQGVRHSVVVPRKIMPLD